jgi:glutamine synthetase
VSDFVARHGLWTQAQQDAAAGVAARIEKLGVVRFAFSDPHGVVRRKTLVAAEAARALRTGVTCTLTMLLKDRSGRTAFPIFRAGGDGAGDMVMVADPCRFDVLPWAPHSGWILCDLYRMDGTPHPYSTRALLRRMLTRLAGHGYTWRAGLEVEFHLLRCAEAVPTTDHIAMPGPPPQVTPLNHGYQYLTEQRYDSLDPLLETLRRHLQELGLPLRSLEVEYGPSQVEVTLGATAVMEPADQMLLLRSATKQIFAREGYLASFMCRPQLPHAASSG